MDVSRLAPYNFSVRPPFRGSISFSSMLLNQGENNYTTMCFHSSREIGVFIRWTRIAVVIKGCCRVPVNCDWQHEALNSAATILIRMLKASSIVCSLSFLALLVYLSWLFFYMFTVDTAMDPLTITATVVSLSQKNLTSQTKLMLSRSSSQPHVYR